MPPPRKFGPWDWIAERARATDSLALPERRLVLPLQEFNAYLESVGKQFKDLRSFRPLLAYLGELRQALEEGIGWIREYVEGDLPYRELESRLREDTAEGFESLLGRHTQIVQPVPAKLPNEVEALLEDVRTIVENLCDEITARGYELHGVLAGSA